MDGLVVLSDKAKSLRILLLEPLYPSSAAWGSVKTEQGFLPPMGTISIYSFLKFRGYNVDLIDTQFGDYNETKLAKVLAKNQYDVVGMPVFTPTADFCFETAKLIRGVLPAAKIVFGNVHASSYNDSKGLPLFVYIL